MMNSIHNNDDDVNRKREKPRPSTLLDTIMLAVRAPTNACARLREDGLDPAA
jgi:hypothetical protein